MRRAAPESTAPQTLATQTHSLWGTGARSPAAPQRTVPGLCRHVARSPGAAVPCGEGAGWETRRRAVARPPLAARHGEGLPLLPGAGSRLVPQARGWRGEEEHTGLSCVYSTLLRSLPVPRSSIGMKHGHFSKAIFSSLMQELHFSIFFSRQISISLILRHSKLSLAVSNIILLT